MPLKSVIALVTVVTVVSAVSLVPTMAHAGYRPAYHRGPQHRHHTHHRGPRHGPHALAGIVFGTLVLGGVAAAYGWPRHHHRGIYGHVPISRGYTWRPSPTPAPPPPAPVRAQYCREFQRDVIIDGKPVRAYGTACLQPDGSRTIVP